MALSVRCGTESKKAIICWLNECGLKSISDSKQDVCLCRFLRGTWYCNKRSNGRSSVCLFAVRKSSALCGTFSVKVFDWLFDSLRESHFFLHLSQRLCRHIVCLFRICFDGVVNIGFILFQSCHLILQGL